MPRPGRKRRGETSHSRLLTVLGTGNPYSGAGLKPDRIMSFYDDKGVWVLPTATGGHRLFTDADSCVDDALVMVTGLHLAGSGGSTSQNYC